jgi:hypothetical protein
MIPSVWKSAAITAFVPILLVAARPAYAQAQAQQPAASSSPWSFDVGVGWDDVISGNINSSGIGQINNQAVVITSNSYEDVFGTGLHLRFGGGYAFSDNTEVTATFVFQSSEADQITPMGDIGVSNLYGKYTDYQTFGLDMGLRRYMTLSSSLRLYGEGAVGVGFIDETDVTLVAPSANLSGDANDFYDQTPRLGSGPVSECCTRPEAERASMGSWASGGSAAWPRSMIWPAPGSRTSTTRALAGRCPWSAVCGFDSKERRSSLCQN